MCAQAAAALLAKSQPCDVDIDKRWVRMLQVQIFCVHFGGNVTIACNHASSVGQYKTEENCCDLRTFPSLF